MGRGTLVIIDLVLMNRTFNKYSITECVGLICFILTDTDGLRICSLLYLALHHLFKFTYSVSKKRLRDFCVCFVLTDGRCDTSVPPPHKVAVVTYPVSVVA